MVARSSGAPAVRPPGAPIGSPASAPMGGDVGGWPPAVTEPSVCGTPGAFGFCAGSNASPRLPGAGAAGGTAGAGRVCVRGCAGREPPFEPSSCNRYSLSSCMRRTCASSCWLRNCSCSITPVSCRIWASRRSRRTKRSGADICAVRSGPADGSPRSLPPPLKRSLPLKMRSSSPNGRSASCAQTKAGHATVR